MYKKWSLNMSTESRNRIIFGAPGTGKSFKLNIEALEKFGEANIERVTFHPNYTYSQFFGTYKPVSTNIDGKKEISYEFVPGPFLRVLKTNYYIDFILKNIGDRDVYVAPNNMREWDFFKNITEKWQTVVWGVNDFSPKKGDFVILHISDTDKELSIKKDIVPGVYAIGEIISNVFEENSERCVELRINDVSFSTPIITEEEWNTVYPGRLIRFERVVKYKSKLIELLEKKSKRLLIIEEINRANVAATFGDVFQLLDRNSVGDSEYPISISEDVKQYLEDNGIDTDTLSIPSNMYIWATMNSADQGVLPMDAAFKRRWDFEYLGIDEGEDTIKDVYIQNGDTKINWNDFRKELNKKLAVQLKVNEDKLLGPWFIKADENNLIDNEKFCSKVLMYLYEDVVKMNPRKLFSNCGEDLRYSEICKQWKQKGSAIFDISITTEKEE